MFGFNADSLSDFFTSSPCHSLPLLRPRRLLDIGLICLALAIHPSVTFRSFTLSRTRYPLQYVHTSSQRRISCIYNFVVRFPFSCFGRALVNKRASIPPKDFLSSKTTFTLLLSLSSLAQSFAFFTHTNLRFQANQYIYQK